MTYEESVEQLESLIEAWQLDEADLNQTDINAMQVLLKENQELKERLERIDNYLDKYYTVENQYWFDHIRDIVEDR